MTDRYFDDFRIGDTFRSAGVTLTESMLLEFAYRYDPQPFHLDKVAAEQSVYGGLIASGWQTLIQSYRMFITSGVFAACAMGSPSLDSLRWLQPVRPGDTLHVVGEVLETKASRSKPDRGFLTMGYTVVNHHGESVLTYSITHMLARRAEGTTEAAGS